MSWAALLLLSAGLTVLRDDVTLLPAGEWRYQRFSVGRALPAYVTCTVEGGDKLAVELVTAGNLEALLHGEAHEAITQSTSGTLQQEIGIPGDFAIVIVNQDRRLPVRTAMRITLDTSGESRAVPRYVSPTRKLVVILSSFVSFLALVTFSTRRLLLAMRR